MSTPAAQHAPVARLHSMYDYRTGDYIGTATQAELEQSVEAAQHDGGSGVIVVDGVSCYVQGSAKA